MSPTTYYTINSTPCRTGSVIPLPSRTIRRHSTVAVVPFVAVPLLSVLEPRRLHESPPAPPPSPPPPITACFRATRTVGIDEVEGALPREAWQDTEIVRRRARMAVEQRAVARVEVAGAETAEAGGRGGRGAGQEEIAA